MQTTRTYGERELLQQIADGSESAFQFFFKTHRSRLYQYILGIVKSREIAEELVLDVFLKIWIGREVIVQVENIEAFLFRIACNKSIDFVRKASRSLQLVDVIWDTIQLSTDKSPETELIQQEYDNVLRKAIALLPAKRREIYQLSREKGLSHSEIAIKLSIAHSTVANQIATAQNFIKSFLLKELDLTIIFVLLLREMDKK